MDARTVRCPAIACLGLAIALSGCRARDHEAARQEPALVELWLGGDVHLGMATHDRLGPLDERVAGALGIVNLEGPVRRGASSRDSLSNAADALASLAAHGVMVVSVANNHALDAGPAGVARTRDAVRQAGMVPAGQVLGEDAARAPEDPPARGATSPDQSIALVPWNGATVAVVATDLSPAYRAARLPAEYARTISADVTRARERADLVVAVFHVRAPPSYLPGPVLEDAVASAVDAGALVVAAHGSHAVARVERRGHGLVVWGLGNLIFDCPCSTESDGLIVRLDVIRGRVDRVELIPIDAGLGGEPARLAREPGPALDLLRSLGTVFAERHATSALL